MATIIDKLTGRVLYATLIETDLKENEIVIEDLLTENFAIPYYNFDTKQFYDGATIEELEVLKLDKIKELKSLQFDELKLTDWYFIRLQETGKEAPNEVVKLRQSIRLKYDELIKEL